MTDCPACSARLETPLGCEACGVLLEAREGLTPFELLGLEPAWDVESGELRRRLLRFTRLTHPDYHAVGTPAARALAENNSALLNDAHEVLADEVTRADWLIRALGGPTEEEERQMPQAFLMEVLEWNETLEAAETAATGSPARVALAGLGEELAERRAATLLALGEGLTPLPPEGADALAPARKKLNAIRYLDRALRKIRELALAGTTTPRS